VSELTVGGRLLVEVVGVATGQCSMACPRPDVRRRFVPAGCEAQVASPRAPVPSGSYRWGNVGRVNASKPLLMPRHRSPRRWVVGAGFRTGRWEAAAPTGRREAGRESTAVPGYRGHPPRPYLARVKRDDPVGVRAQLPGKPTARKAQSPSGRTMAKKRTPVVERQQEIGTRWLAPPPVVLDNWPDTGPCGPARKGAQVAR
jgi:hypothetical protein